MFDLHVHSKNSHDSKQTLPEICESAIEKGIQGVAICDHADVWFFDKDGTENCIALCMKEIDEARERYGDRLEIFKGIEMAEYLDDSERAERLLLAHPYDRSQHSLRGYHGRLFPHRLFGDAEGKDPRLFACLSRKDVEYGRKDGF